MADKITMRYIREVDRPINIPYPYKFLVDVYAAHPVICLIMWCFIVSCMLGLCLSPYVVFK